MTNAKTISGRMNINSVSQIENIAKGLSVGFHVVAVFDYRCAMSTCNITLPSEALDQRKFCEEVGAELDNHQVIVCVRKSSYSSDKWVVAHFSDHLVYVNDDLDNLKIYTQ